MDQEWLIRFVEHRVGDRRKVASGAGSASVVTQL
jgi:hypothetical protein